MRRSLLLLVLIFTGCATLPIFQSLIGKHLSVNVPGEIPLPETLTLNLGSQFASAAKMGSLLGGLGGETLEKRLNKSLKQAAAPLSKAGAEAFKDELQKAQLFGSVVNNGGDLGMAIGISRWGLAYDDISKHYRPVLDLQASLKHPTLGTVWKAERSAAQLSVGVMEKVNSMDLASLIAKPQSYQEVMALAVRDLSQQLVEDLRKNPPSAR